MKWAGSLLALTPVAFVGWLYFMLRSHRDTGRRATFFRGVWPWSFSEDELSRLGDPC